MKNGKYASRRRGVSAKVLALTLALVLVVGGVVGGTLAWLTDSTSEVKNTFTTSDVDIDMTETEATYQIIPGYTIAKDPTVTVNAGSEKCYVFVKLVEAKWPNFVDTAEDGSTTRKVNYELADGWTLVDGQTDVYYRVQDAVAAGTADKDLPTFPVLKDNEVTVSGTLTKSEMGQITTNPTLTVTAYACQYYKSNTATEDDANGTPFTPAEAWANVNA